MALSVERGLATITGTNTSTTVTLGTPVAENESAATVSAYGESTRSARSQVTATLQTVVDGAYTELLIERGGPMGTGFDVNVRWVVMSHPDWSVQIVTDTIATSTNNKTISFTSVGSDLSETFIIQGGQTSNQDALDAKRGVCWSRLTSTTAGELRRNSTDATYTCTAVVYVVTWTGATVERGTTTMVGGAGATGRVKTQAVTTIDQTDTIINYSCYCGDGVAADRDFPSARFSSNSEITFEREDDGATGDDVNISWEVISHAGWTVQSDFDTAASGATITHTLGTAVDLSRSAVLGHPVQGNSHAVDSSYLAGRTSHYLSSTTAVTTTRQGTTSSFDANVFVVEFDAAAPTGTQAYRRFSLNIS